jgi:hypothetical protein
VWLVVQDTEGTNFQALRSGDWHTSVEPRAWAARNIGAVTEACVLRKVVDDVDDVRRVFVLTIGASIGRKVDGLDVKVQLAESFCKDKLYLCSEPAHGSNFLSLLVCKTGSLNLYPWLTYVFAYTESARYLCGAQP